MADHLHNQQHRQIGADRYHVPDVPLKNGHNNNNFKLSTLRGVDQQQQSPASAAVLLPTKKKVLAVDEKSNISNQPKNDATTKANEIDSDDNDVVVGKLRNGCDRTAEGDHQHIISPILGKLENVHLSANYSSSLILQSAAEDSKENIPIKTNSSISTIASNAVTTPASAASLTSTSPSSSSSLLLSVISKTTNNVDSDAVQSLDTADVATSPSLLNNMTNTREINEDEKISPPQDQTSKKQEEADGTFTSEDLCTRSSSTAGESSSCLPSSSSLPYESQSTLASAQQKTGVIALKSQSLESRPIYPNVPYSPYASPYSSPRSNRRRPPLRESRRISIEQSGSFLQLNQYKLMDQIGQGSYGLVKLAYSEEDSTHYAMKILSKRRLLRQAGLMRRGPKKSTTPLDRVYREIAVLKKLDHPNVVKLIEVLDDPIEDSLYMVFELVKLGEVLGIPTKSPLKEERAWSVFRDTLLGLEYLHYQRIIHADLKPGNLLLTECGRVKIADLGVCNEFIGENATMTNGSSAGTPAFRAPESLKVGENIYCGKAADIWALGATLYSLVFGNVPFAAASVHILYEKIKAEPLSFPDTPNISEELRDCIERMLAKEPCQRITLPQLKEHPWVSGSGLHPLPSEEENCRLVQVNDDDINSVVRSIPKLDTLILIKTMLKKHSFGNPFSRGVSGRAPQSGGSRLERFVRAGRSNSAPGAYNMIVERQLSGDNILPALTEHSGSNSANNEESQ